MPLDDYKPRLVTVSGPMPVRKLTVHAAEWRSLGEEVRGAGGKLLALWGIDDRARSGNFLLHAALVFAEGVLVMVLPVARADARFPDLSDVFPAAGRMQRALADLLGVSAAGADARKWLRHAAWPADTYPLRQEFDVTLRGVAGTDDYPFVTVQGGGVHEIAVGPVHAGTIEPGHFRFSVVG